MQAHSFERPSPRLVLFLTGLAIGVSWLAACAHKSDADAGSSTPTQVFRVVRTKQMQALAVLEKRHFLDDDLKPLGFSVQWLEFAAGPQQLEALNAGELDLALTAESPPVFAQAAGGQLVYLATTAPSGKATSLLVNRDSQIQSVAGLRGKRVAFQKASIGHYLLVKALERAGMTLNDVVSVFLPPADANAAFSEKSVDAWFIWEPFATRAVLNASGRVLLDGEGLRDTGNFYTTTRAFVDAHSDVLRVFLAELERCEVWSREHPREMAELLTPFLQIDVPTLLQMHQKYTFGVLPITEAVEARQQAVADLWFRLGFLPQKLNVRAGFLSPERYASLLPPPHSP
jgi:sulfonate transport system substrate-binding protein